MGSAAPPLVIELCSLRDPGEIASLRNRLALIGERWNAEMQEKVVRRQLAEQTQQFEGQLREQARYITKPPVAP